MMDNYFMTNEINLPIGVREGSVGMVRYHWLGWIVRYGHTLSNRRNLDMHFFGPIDPVGRKGMQTEAVVGTAPLRQIQRFFEFFLADHRSTTKYRDELPKTFS